MATINNEVVMEKDEKTTAFPLRAEKQSTFKVVGVILLFLVVIIVNYFLFHQKEPEVALKKESDTFQVPNLNTTKAVVADTTTLAKNEVVDNASKLELEKALAEAKAKDFIERLQASQNDSDTPMNALSTVAASESHENNETNEHNVTASDKITDPNTAFLMRASNSKAEHVYATHFGKLPYLIGQGKFIFATLAVALNSDLPGQMTAIVSQDVYGEQGRKILIPKGSLLIGEYKSGLVNHQSRLFVVWTRVREPSGIDVMLGSEGTDELGRAGLTGGVDYHFFARFGSAFLIAMIGAGASTVGVNPDDQYNASQVYRQNVSQALAQQANNMLNRSIDIPPTIRIAQGRKIVVFVNRDLDFSRVVR